MAPPHPAVARAAAGELPDWSHATAARKHHMERVATLLEEWAAGLGLPEEERVRWRAVAYLHDAVRNAPDHELRPLMPPGLTDLPGPLLHGPAAAQRLWADGVRDGELLTAIAYHTLGHPELGRLGRALYAADFLEPGRNLLNEWREGLRARMPDQLDAVVRDVLAARLRHLVERGSRVRAETIGFWNTLAGEG